MLPLVLADVLRHQCGVVSRAQALGLGLRTVDIKRLRARRELVTVFEGVYVTHTGPLTWEQRAWAAVLVHAPAALAGEAALHSAYGGSASRHAEPELVELVVERHRRVVDPPGVRSTRISDYAGQVLENLTPPRVRVEHAALTVASRAERLDQVAAGLGEVCQSGRTTPARLLAHLHGRARLPRRRLILAVLEDVAQGANSALERRYLCDVERAHALPRGVRQRRVVAGSVTAYQDVAYQPQRTVVELDGRLGHDHAQDRWDDLDRDIAAALDGSVTLRAGWRQVLEACRLATSVAQVLHRRGWTDSPRRCARPGCRVA